MDFNDPELQHYYSRIASWRVGGLADNVRPVYALMAAYDHFRHLDGEESPRIREVLDRLAAPELRPAVRTWFQQCGHQANPCTEEVRQILSGVLGESL